MPIRVLKVLVRIRIEEFHQLHVLHNIPGLAFTMDNVEAIGKFQRHLWIW